MTKECPHCGSHSEGGSGEAAPENCASCGRSFDSAPTPWEAALGPIRRYFMDVWSLITEPTQFFRKMPLSGGVTGPLAFALVTHWLGSALGYLWRTLATGIVEGYWQHIFSALGSLGRVTGDFADIDSPGRGHMLMQARDQFMHWTLGVGSVLVDPFLTLLGLLFTSFFVFVGARLLVTPGKNGAPREITYESALRVVCYGLSPAILAAIPLAGGVIAAICVAIITIIGAREVYRIPTFRATVVGLFPKVLFLGILVSGMLFFAVFVIKWLAS